MRKTVRPCRALLTILTLVLLLPGVTFAVEINWTEHVITTSYHHDPIDIELFDIDDDGDMDLVTGATFFGSGALAWWENDGAQTFTEHVLTNTGNFWLAKPVDIDGDNHGDIVVSRGGVGGSEGSDYRLTLYENDGSENFTEIDLRLEPSSFHAVVLPVDLDGDNDMDIVFAARTSTLGWLENVGSPTFVEHIVDSATTGINASVTVDYDNDNDLDIVSMHDGTGGGGIRIFLWTNSGSEVFTQSLLYQFSDPSDTASDLEVLDLDNDGDKDIVARYFRYLVDGAVLWLENDGTDTFTENVLDATVTEGGEVAVADLDADGDPDIVAGHYRVPGWIRWFDNDGSGGFTPRTVTTSDFSGTNFAIGDIDGDQSLDIAGNAFFLRDISWWENDLEYIGVPMSSRWSILGTAILLLAVLLAATVWRWRRA